MNHEEQQVLYVILLTLLIGLVGVLLGSELKNITEKIDDNSATLNRIMEVDYTCNKVIADVQQ